MRINALEDWTYIPEFGGNREEAAELQTAYTFTLLSGKEEMDLRRDGKETFPTSFETVVKNVKNPPILVSANGKEVKATVADLGTRPELKGLFLELIVAYSSHAKLDGESEKN